MIWLGLSILFFVAVGVIIIVRRDEVAQGIAMTVGATASTGCAVAVGVMFLLIAATGIILAQLGLFGRL